MFVEKTKINRKEAGDGPFFKKNLPNDSKSYLFKSIEQKFVKAGPYNFKSFLSSHLQKCVDALVEGCFD